MPYATSEKTKSTVRNPVEFLTEARRFYTFGMQADAVDRAEAKDDNEFANASDTRKTQWDRVAFQARFDKERPILQWNRIPTFVAQVVNDGRQNKPAIKISQADGGQRETAEFYQDRIRHIEYECNADTAYDTAREQQVTSGRAAIRLSTEWVPGKWRQKICIEPINDQFSVVWDPAAQLYDRSDAEWVFVTSLISKEKHIRDYGETATVNRSDFSGFDNPAPDWIGIGEKGELIQIAEYWKKVYKKRRLLSMGKDHIPVWRDALTDQQYEAFTASGMVRSEREEDDCTIMQYVINGAEILSEEEWIGTKFPIVPMWGRMAVVDGNPRTFSLIRNAKDPQRAVNVYVSNIMELVAQMPKTPYLAAVGTIPANLEGSWQTASNSPLGFLLYNPYDTNGQPTLPRPERIMQEPPIQALTIALQQSIDAIKAAMGIYDASLGARSNETSGIAIERRKNSAEVVNYHFPDNEARTRKAIGEQLLELIAKLDDGEEVATRSEDGKTTMTPVGKPFQNPKTGQEVIHNLAEGDYGVTVATGKSTDSKRQEEREALTTLISGVPETFAIIGDRWIELSDVPGSEEDADRVRRWINMKTPGLIPPDPDKQQMPIPPEVQQQVAELQQQAKVAMDIAQKLKEEADAKLPELELKKYIADEQEKTKRIDILSKVAMTEATTELEQTLGIVHKVVDQAHEASMKQADQAHEKETLGATQAHDAAKTVATQDHAASMAERGHEQTMEQAEQAADLQPVVPSKAK